MERAVLLLRPEQRAKLKQLAKNEHVSIAEINRRAIEAYDPHSPTDAELEQLADAVIQSTTNALHALEEANKAVNETLDYFKQKQGNC